MRRWKLLLVAALVLFIALAVALNPSSPKATLSDGSVLEVVAVTFGTNHTFSASSRWRGWLRGVTPNRWRKFITPPQPTKTASTPKDCAVIWLRCFDPRTGTFRSLGGWDWRILDQHGCAFPVADWVRSGPTNNALAWVVAETYPRRQPTFELSGRLKEEAVSLKIQNPNPVRPVEWRPDPLPASRRIGEVEMSLTKFDGMFRSNIVLSFRPRFEFSQSGQIRSNAYRVDALLMDATGNRARQLCPFEPAWKIAATIFPSAFADFPEERIIHLGKVRTPHAGEAMTLELTEATRTLGVFYVGFTGRGQFILSNSVWAASKPVGTNQYLDWGSSGNSSDFRRGYWQREMRVYRPTLWLVSSNAPALENYLARVRDAKGHIYPDRNASMKSSVEERIYFRNCFFALPDDAGEIELELFPFQPARVEFLVTPPMSSGRTNH